MHLNTILIVVLTPLLFQLSTIEFSQIQNQVLQSLNKGSEVLKELQKEMSLERAEGIMDRVGEGVAAQRASPLRSVSVLMQAGKC